MYRAISPADRRSAFDRGLDVAGLDGGSVQLSTAQLESLAAGIAAPLLVPGDVGWDDAVRLWNGLAARLPALVVQPSSAREAAFAVRFAAGHGLLLGVRGGGHNIAGTAVAAGGLLLDMSLMAGVDVDPAARLATAGPGCRLHDLDRATQRYGLATVLGFISEVGVAGLTLGGGLGYLSRRFGWTVDNLEAVEIVTADGRICTASRQENADLFWAVRGAGANFGVVTRFAFRLHEVGPTVYGGLIAWPFERADEILRAYRDFTSRAPREQAVWMLLLTAPPAPFVPAQWHGRRICAMAVCYSGDLARTDEVMAPVRALGTPLVDLLAEQPYAQVQSYLDDTEPKGMHYYWKTEYVTELSDDLLAEACRSFATCPIADAEIGFLHLAGDLNDHDDDDGAVGNRDVKYVMGCNGMWDPDDANGAQYRSWIHGAGQRLRPFTAGRTYINFQTADEDDGRIRATFGANFARLAALKRAYDPGNLFRSNRNIPPAPAGQHPHGSQQR
ncbi:FAD-binding oxidoreductase [Arthrobacter sp. I2-34]|uniref:FAD-binding oxidoreductase n=1 Tax=Arthrobacter hankyongi TaxID=2904801 RepID=A0ABS9LD35_9MICC|nr:FAD-binding oxidoreductase [Arthrobacter hankyongi]MCG2624609.1 FAD-binding oxidoreductase [Arthrobacter hankyongi]